MKYLLPPMPRDNYPRYYAETPPDIERVRILQEHLEMVDLDKMRKDLARVSKVAIVTDCQHLLRDDGDCVRCGQHLRSVGKYATLRELHNGSYCESCESYSKQDPWIVLDPAKGDSK